MSEFCPCCDLEYCDCRGLLCPGCGRCTAAHCPGHGLCVEGALELLSLSALVESAGPLRDAGRGVCELRRAEVSPTADEPSRKVVRVPWHTGARCSAGSDVNNRDRVNTSATMVSAPDGLVPGRIVKRSDPGGVADTRRPSILLTWAGGEVSRWSHKPEEVGSIPTPTFYPSTGDDYRCLCGLTPDCPFCWSCAKHCVCDYESNVLPLDFYRKD